MIYDLNNIEKKICNSFDGGNYSVFLGKPKFDFVVLYKT